MLQHVWERASEARYLHSTLIATDDAREELIDRAGAIGRQDLQLIGIKSRSRHRGAYLSIEIVIIARTVAAGAERHRGLRRQAIEGQGLGTQHPTLPRSVGHPDRPAQRDLHRR